MVCQTIAQQRWLSKRIRRLIIRAISSGFLLDYNFQTSFFGYIYEGNTRNLIDRKVLFSGCHECDVLAFVKDVLGGQENPVFVDIGANIGHHTLFASRYASRVYAFEPYASVREKLSDKLERNGIENVKVVSVALGDKTETRRFFAPPVENLGTGSFVEQYSEKNKVDQYLEICRLDDIFTEMGIAQASLMKIDVEGFEKQVLSGASQMMRLMRPVVLFENSMYLDDALHNLQDIRDIFPENYLFYRFSHRGKRRHGCYRLLELSQEMFTDRRQLALVAAPREQAVPLSAGGRLAR